MLLHRTPPQPSFSGETRGALPVTARPSGDGARRAGAGTSRGTGGPLAPFRSVKIGRVPSCPVLRLLSVHRSRRTCPSGLGQPRARPSAGQPPHAASSPARCAPLPAQAAPPPSPHAGKARESRGSSAAAPHDPKS